jgi:phage anti-repressor protein
MNIIELHNIADKKITQTELIPFIEANISGFVLKTRYDYIGSCMSSIDVMQDHLEMAFILEKLSQYSKITQYEKNYEVYPPEILITLVPNKNDIVLLAKELHYVSLLKTEESDPNEEDLEDILIDLWNFEENIEQISFNFSDEIEDYYANYIYRGIYEMASESTDDDEVYLEDCFRKNPEWKYGFWKNHLQNTPKESLYFSSFCWILKNNVDVNSILSKYSGIENVTFDEASSINDLIINDFTAIDFNSLKNFNVAISFINSLTGFSDTNTAFWVSQNFDIVKISYSGYYILYFDFEKVKEEFLKELYNETSLLYQNLSALLGFSKDIACNWNILTDESFEELCYDIIYNDIRFDNQTIQKMGKSKSRDGGRDIAVYTKPKFGNPAKKYIIQCKLLKKTASLTKTMMNNSANVIMQYQADGYIVMTNAVIDSTLSDMLDDFKKNPKMNTDTSTYSKYELERYLARNIGIKQRYFTR